MPPKHHILTRITLVGLLISGACPPLSMAQTAPSAGQPTTAASLSLNVQVLGTDGKPVNRSTITLWQATSSAPSPESLIWSDPTTGKTWIAIRTWATGDTTTATDLPPRDYRVTAMLSYNDPAPLGVSEPIHLDAQHPAAPVTVHLQTGPALHLRFVDSQTDQPIEDARVELVRFDGLPVAIWSNATPGFWADKGNLSFPQLAPGEYALRAQKLAPYCGDFDYALPNGPMKITVADKDQTLNVKLTPVKLTQAESEKRWPWAVLGAVTSPEGKPMQGVEIRAHCGLGTLFQTGRTISDADGNYTLRFAPGIQTRKADGSWGVGYQAATITAHLSGYSEEKLCRQGDLRMDDATPADPRSKNAQHVVLPGKPFEVDFVMCPAAQLQGRLLDESGRPKAHCPIWVDGHELPPSSSVVAVAKTDDAGQFRLDNIPIGYAWRVKLGNTGLEADLHLDKPGPQAITLRVQPGGHRLLLELSEKASTQNP